MTTSVVFILLAIAFLVLYVARRRSRLRVDD